MFIFSSTASMVPEAAAAGALYVSAENAQFENKSLKNSLTLVETTDV
jgi:hypothetical protein